MHVLMRLAVAILRCMYATIACFTKPRDQVTFLSRQASSPSLDITYLVQELAARSDNVKIVVLCKTLHKSIGGLISYGIHLVTQMVAIAQSRVLVLDGYSILASILPKRKDLFIVQMGHSMGTMKKFGHAVLGKQEGSSRATAEIMNMHANYDCVLASSPEYYDDLIAGYNCSPDALRTHPLPRYDALKSTELRTEIRNIIYQRYPVLESKKVVVYCPTFRKDESDHQRHIDELINAFPFEMFHLVVKVHPLSKIVITDPRVLAARDLSSFDMLFVADAVISDYSCIIYEAGLLRTPLYFFAFDLEDYDVARGLAIDYAQEMPGPICYDAHHLVAELADGQYDMDRLERFIDKYVSFSEHATVDIADMLLEQLRLVRR